MHWLFTVTSHLINPFTDTLAFPLLLRHPAGMASQTSLVLDDTSDVFSYGGGAWKTNKASRWFNGSTQYPAFVVAGNGLYGTMNLTFHGELLSFFFGLGCCFNLRKQGRQLVFTEIRYLSLLD